MGKRGPGLTSLFNAIWRPNTLFATWAGAATDHVAVIAIPPSHQALVESWSSLELTLETTVPR